MVQPAPSRQEPPPAASSWRSVQTPPSPVSAASSPNPCAPIHPANIVLRSLQLAFADVPLSRLSRRYGMPPIIAVAAVPAIDLSKLTSDRTKKTTIMPTTAIATDTSNVNTAVSPTGEQAAEDRNPAGLHVLACIRLALHIVRQPRAV